MEPITVSRMMDLAIKLGGTYINVDGAHGNQCWDSAARVAQLLGLPVVHTHGAGRWPGWAGNMWDAFPQSPEIAAAYYRVGPDQPGMPGDTAIWGDSNPYYPSTHVANVVRNFDGTLLCLSQNSSAPRPDLPGYSAASSGPTILQHLPKKGLLGYLRPFTGINTQGNINEGDDLMATPEERKALIRELLDEQVDQVGGGKNTLRELLAEARTHHLDVIRVVGGVDDAVEADVNAARDSVNFNTQKQVEAVGRVTQQLIMDGAKPTVIVDQIVAAGIATEVADLLAKRLVK